MKQSDRKSSGRNLKTSLLFLLLIAFTTSGNAQFLKKLGKAAERAAKRTVERRVENETSEKTDAALDSILEPGKGKKKKGPKSKEKETNNQSSDKNTSTGISKDESNTSEPKTLSIYKKFDFVPGEKLLFFDNFSNEFVGDFPSKWNTDGGGEIVTVSDSDQKWLELRMSSFFIPDVPDLPEEYTIEFDVLTTGLDRNTSSSAKLHVILDESDSFGYGKNAVYTYLPFCQYVPVGIRIWGQTEGKVIIDNTITADIRKVILNKTHISIAVNKTRYRLWVNEVKYIDVPRLVPTSKIKSLKFEPTGFSIGSDGNERMFITNVKVAEGGLDLRRKLIGEGKISTNGILFDSGSANIQPQSMGIIRQISQVLQQESGINLKIVGHTDADGADDVNLELSKSRANTVKKALTDVYKVDESRLSIDGKGETEPLDDNATTGGKAQNRRVEFIKQ